jgi:RimJ/RimL family protein N-acetyltransferase
MAIREDLIFRQVVTLRDGVRVLFRPMISEDHQALLELFQPLGPDELRFMRHDVTDPELIRRWTEKIEYHKVFPLVALVGERAVGLASLHFYQGPCRHRAELRIFLAKDFRSRSLGTRMVQAMIDIARRRNLHFLEVQIVSDLINDIRAMQSVGFEVKCSHEDAYMMPDGELRDVVHLIYRLRVQEDDEPYTF